MIWLILVVIDKEYFYFLFFCVLIFNDINLIEL